MLPREIHKRKTTLEVGMMHTRSADTIRLSYDSDRDGWIIEQASTFWFEVDDKVCDPDWKEVAFVQAWGREKKVEGAN